MSAATQLAVDWTEQGRMPDAFVRAGIRRLVRERLEEIRANDCDAMGVAQASFIDDMDSAPIALVPEKANEQHYEVPAEFFAHVLGAHRKYSSCVWADDVTDLSQAEALALEVTCQRAAIIDGQSILELGCGWGSLTLWMAQHYPSSRITAVSNSESQREFIRSQAQQRGFNNLDVITCDMNCFQTDQRFDRVVSVEMFEHMRNWRLLFDRIHDWLVPGGRFFMHVFCHRAVPYAFLDNGPQDWMSRYFFSGGMMPSDDLPLWFQRQLSLKRRWRWDGTHYQRTANAWLANMDKHREKIWPILESTYGREQAGVWWMRWRLFFMACAELFGYDNGQQWWVSHYLFERPVA
ncbi:MAG: cyclopropane-fatty-acyl-phospholipid synthase family protein [Gammaproteobacteria bacterium]|nr:cyclopropane-fatty-acyl-phospholipid synthase family protein [Gammaproteobacteria bacterium]MDH3465165.1 cyclopropane-fatty-acyl-phospholipid synthase family protein [Gammaproteobacteria bacterium]